MKPCVWASAVRCVDCQGNGAVDAVIAALDWLAGAYKLPAVASLSLGSNSINAALDTALQSVIALGVTGIVAAGNYQSGEIRPRQPSKSVGSSLPHLALHYENICRRMHDSLPIKSRHCFNDMRACPRQP